MCGEKRTEEEIFHYFSLESRVPSDHLLRAIRALCDQILKGMSGTFNTIPYGATRALTQAQATLGEFASILVTVSYWVYARSLSWF